MSSQLLVTYVGGQDGERIALPTPFTGGRSIGCSIDDSEREYYATLRAYYAAVAAACCRQGGGAFECRGDASVLSREYVGWEAGRAGKVGGNFGSGESGAESEVSCGSFDASGVVGSGCGDTHAGPSRASGVASKSDIAEPVDVFGVDRSEHVNASVRGNSGFARTLGGTGVNAERGKHYFRNKARREKKKAMNGQWRKVDGSGGCVSDSSVAGTVVTVDSRTAEEVEAARTLALRRTAENAVAQKMAELKLVSLNDATRTAAIDKVVAARYEERINTAKARAQAAYKKTDQSLKSLGSTGSAGEFALKQEIQKAKSSEELNGYLQRQLDLAIKDATPATLRAISKLPPPRYESAVEAFGSCPSEFDEDEATAYYAQLQEIDDNNYDRFNVGETYAY